MGTQSNIPNVLDVVTSVVRTVDWPGSSVVVGTLSVVVGSSWVDVGTGSITAEEERGGEESASDDLLGVDVGSELAGGREGDSEDGSSDEIDVPRVVVVGGTEVVSGGGTTVVVESSGRDEVVSGGGRSVVVVGSTGGTDVVVGSSGCSVSVTIVVNTGRRQQMPSFELQMYAPVVVTGTGSVVEGGSTGSDGVVACSPSVGDEGEVTLAPSSCLLCSLTFMSSTP